MSPFEFYKKFGCRLMPLKPGTRTPNRRNWVDFEGVDPKDYPDTSFGWALDKHHLVIDVDPRNGGVLPFKELAAEYEQLTGEKIGKRYPMVKTPRGGLHIYMTKPEKVAIVKGLKALPGIDFLSYKSYCVTEGSQSEYGSYHFINPEVAAEGPQPVPGFILAKIKRTEAEIKKDLSCATQLTNSQIEKMLAQLPIEDFTDYPQWLQVLQSVHEASAGEALDLFLEWSLQDPTYANDRESITKQWLGHKAGKADNITAGTLIHLVKQYDGEIPQPDLHEELGRLPELDETVPRKVGEITRDGRETVAIPVTQIEQMIGELEPSGKIDRIDHVLRHLLKTGKPDKNRLLKLLSRRTQYLVSDLRDRMVLLKSSETTVPTLNDDPAYQVTDIVLTESFDAEDRVTHAVDQRFWSFHRTHWAVVERNIIRNRILKACQIWAAQNPEKKIALSSLLQQSERILEARLASGIDFYKQRQAGDTIINCKNGELLVNAESGRVKLHPHNPQHWLIHCLPIVWDPNAVCPMFNKFLLEVFEPLPDTTDVIRHLWELIGYTLQTCKDIAAWVLLTGEGSNGKTTLLNIIQALLGDTALSTSLSDISKDSHGMECVPGKLMLIDEDLNAKFRLPDGLLKKVSENKMLPVNPKHSKGFNFENTAIIWMAANTMPSTRDMSHGMIRRAQVLHFGRIFTPKEQDRGLAKRILRTELPGILVQALEGLRRLRVRGYFDVPKSAKLQTQKWSTQSSPMSLWVFSALVDSDGKILLRDAYTHFRLWCQDQGLDKPASKPSFRKGLESAGYKVATGGKNQLFIYNVDLVKIEEDGLEL